MENGIYYETIRLKIILKRNFKIKFEISTNKTQNKQYTKNELK